MWSCRIFAGVTVFCIAMPYQSHFPLTEAKFLLYEHYIVSCDTKKYNTRFFEQAFNQCSRLYTLENELRQSVGCLMCHTIWLNGMRMFTPPLNYQQIQWDSPYRTWMAFVYNTKYTRTRTLIYYIHQWRLSSLHSIAVHTTVSSWYFHLLFHWGISNRNYWHLARMRERKRHCWCTTSEFSV